MTLKNMKSGFTLIEMTIVLFIISLLILIIIPNLNNQRHKAQTIHESAMTSMIQTQIDSYLSTFPSSDVKYNSLEQSGYLTGKQVDEAQKEGIQIVNNHAQKN
ncbi:competence protein ComGC [Philodulcilactobacillus myokoensis]|uniref:Competence protein ComGC n=1 Tax=Philodulcilactobacillus myokoensis TaxID=2929573 RepID=A0A9W6ESQ0_9LACO|nr:competence type IV pilus major pilin ComGC [Philodulcilactobacillus myokoensis]GLB46702.1 competence protein ComGC [Philodulcilactobacillus myokoensis]